MRLSTTVAWLLLVAAASLLGSEPARACTCVNEPRWKWPRRDATVPPNARFFANSRDELDRRAALFNEAGVLIEGSWSTISRPHEYFLLNVFTPASDLVVGETYTLKEQYDLQADEVPEEMRDATWEEALWGSGSTLLRVHVEGLPDDAAPALPAVELLYSSARVTDSTGNTASCDMGEHATALAGFSLEPPSESTLLVVDLLDEASLDIPAASGVASFIEPFLGHLDVGTSICGVRWPSAQAGDRGHIRIGLLDVAGNFSGWSEAVEFEYLNEDEEEDEEPDEPSLSCSSSDVSGTSGSGFAALVLALLTLLFVRSRRCALVTRGRCASPSAAS